MSTERWLGKGTSTGEIESPVPPLPNRPSSPSPQQYTSPEYVKEHVWYAAVTTLYVSRIFWYAAEVLELDVRGTSSSPVLPVPSLPNSPSPQHNSCPRT